MSATAPPPVVLVAGDDPILLAQAVQGLVDDLTAGVERSLAVDDFRGDEYDLAQVTAAAATPPFLVERRVVVAWGVQRFAARRSADAADEQAEEAVEVDTAPRRDDPGLAPLLAYLAAPVGTSTIVLEWAPTGSPARAPRVPKALADAVARAGGAHEQVGLPKRGASRAAWLEERLAARSLALRPAARTLLLDRLGEDLGRLDPLLDALRSAYGEGVLLDAEEVEPFLGEAGDVLPWDLTDAIAGGDLRGALVALERMLGVGRHPLQVLATLTATFRRLLALDGDDRPASSLTFPDRKAADHLRAIGPEGLREAVRLLAEADVDLRGGTGYPDEVGGRLVLEVLVARLSRLARARGRAARGARRA